LLPTSIEQEKKDDFLLLFVDDDIESLNTYRRLLKDKYKYDLCHSINDAKIIAASKKYDIIFLDINLSSNFNGFELLDYYLTYPHLHDTYFVALTAYASSEDRLRIKSAGFSNFLAKPFTKDELIGIIEKRRKEIQK
jgi:CheY-like chemotaxis protein